MSLDIGCGWSRGHTKQGILGIDINRGKADVICDAHFLPFKKDVFTEVFLIRALEYFKNPSLAMEEVRRICKHKAIVNIIHPLKREKRCWHPLYLLDALLLRTVKGERSFNYKVHHNSTLDEIALHFKIIRNSTVFYPRHLRFFEEVLHRQITLGGIWCAKLELSVLIPTFY